MVRCIWGRKVSWLRWRGDGKKDDDPGGGWWAAASCLDCFVGWVRGRMKVPSVMGWLLEGAWDGMICGGIPQINWARGETHCSKIAQRKSWIRGRLIVREESWCKTVEWHQRGSALIACGGTTNRWGGRDVLWIVYSWRRLSQKTISHVENSSLRLYCKCWLKRGYFILRTREIASSLNFSAEVPSLVFYFRAYNYRKEKKIATSRVFLVKVHSVFFSEE